MYVVAWVTIGVDGKIEMFSGCEAEAVACWAIVFSFPTTLGYRAPMAIKLVTIGIKIYFIAMLEIHISHPGTARK